MSTDGSEYHLVVFHCWILVRRQDSPVNSPLTVFLDHVLILPSEVQINIREDHNELSWNVILLSQGNVWPPLDVMAPLFI